MTESVPALAELTLLSQRAAAGSVGTLTPAVREAIGKIVAELPDAEAPQDLVARPCPTSAAVWHWKQLRRLLDDEGADGRSRCSRIAFHCRWILSLARPDDDETRPLVSVVVPVYNRADLVGEAIDSALGQTYRRVEIVVVDDGSTDDLETTLAAYGDRIRCARQSNRGVSSARNRAIDLATGDYICFLDSDNVLDPCALERWIEACRSVGDAEICYSPVRFRHMSLVKPGFLKPPNGGPDCPTRDLLEVVAHRHPFAMTGVMLPRWLVLEAQGFDERLRRGEDTRFWFELGLRRTKVIGLKMVMGEAKRLETGLNATKAPGEHARIIAMNFLDLLRRPEHMDLLTGCFRAIVAREGWRWLGSSREPLVAETRDGILCELERLGEDEQLPDPAVARVLSTLLELARRGEKQLCGRPEDHDFHRRFVASVARALESAGR